MPLPKLKSYAAYDLHPSVMMVQKMLAGLKDKTGRSLQEWIQLARKQNPKDETSLRAWLKDRHGLGTNYAWWLAEQTFGKADDGSPEAYLKSADRYVSQLFAGNKAALRPIYDALLQLGRGLGSDVKVCPCQTTVPFYRHHVFAQIKPASRTRMDLGLALRDTKTPERLIDTGGFLKRDRITHRIELSASEEIDDEVKHWLKKAYEMDEPPRKGKPAVKFAS